MGCTCQQFMSIMARALFTGLHGGRPSLGLVSKQSNDGWFTTQALPPQHLQWNVFHAPPTRALQMAVMGCLRINLAGGTHEVYARLCVKWCFCFVHTLSYSYIITKF